jgi:propanediol utilization protein
LGIRAPIRESGDLIGTPGITIEGPRGRVSLGTGVICAHRHLHLSPAEANRLALQDRERVSVSTSGRNRSMLFDDVLVRVSPDYRLELHLDSDEADAAGLHSGDEGILMTRRHIARAAERPFAPPTE